VKTLLQVLFPALLIPVALAQSLETGEKRSRPHRMETHVYGNMDGCALELDLRLPESPTPNHPGVVFIHGGGFQTGRKDATPNRHFLDALADSGIISASISYRLTRADRGFGCDVPIHEKQEAVRLAAEDLMKALDWLETHPRSASWPGDWVAAGSSAGAETALYAGYVDSPLRWKGILSFSGALDASARPPSHGPALFAVHGTCDRVVPPRVDIHRFCSEDSPGAWPLIGGIAWADSLRSRGTSAWTWSQCGGDHMVCNTAMQDHSVQAMVLEWLSGKGESQRDVVVGLDGQRLKSGRSSCPQPCN